MAVDREEQEIRERLVEAREHRGLPPEHRVVHGAHAQSHLEADELAAPSALNVALPRAAERALLKALTVKAEARTRSIRE